MVPITSNLGLGKAGGLLLLVLDNILGAIAADTWKIEALYIKVEL